MKKRYQTARSHKMSPNKTSDDWVDEIEKTSLELQSNPQSFDARYRRSRAHLNLGNYEMALSDINYAIACGLGGYRSYALRMAIRYVTNDEKGALEDLPLAMKDTANKIAVYFIACALYQKSGRIAEWHDAVQQLLKEGAREASSFEEGAKFYEYMGLAALAAECYQAALSLDPSNNRLRQHYAVLLASQNEHEKALALYTRGYQKEALTDAEFVASVASFMVFLPHEAVHDFFNQAIEFHPLNGRLRLYRALHNMGRCDIEIVLADADCGVRLLPHEATAWSLRGLINSKAGNFERARADYNQAISLDPHSLEDYAARAEVKLELGDESADKDFLHLMAHEDYVVTAFTGRIQLQINLGNFDSAARIIRSVPPRYYSDPDIQKIRLKLAYYMKRYDECIAISQKVLAYGDAENVPELYSAMSYLALNKPDEALRGLVDFEEDGNSEHDWKLAIEAEAYYLKKKFKKANEYALVAVNNDPSGGAHYVLGLLEEKNKRCDTARQHFSTAADLGHEGARDRVREKKNPTKKKVWRGQVQLAAGKIVEMCMRDLQKKPNSCSLITATKKFFEEYEFVNKPDMTVEKLYGNVKKASKNYGEKKRKSETDK